MIGHASHVDHLRELTRDQLDRELRQELTDSLQELVACVEQSLPPKGNTLRSCVIDDFEIDRVELGTQECRVNLRFNASVRLGGKALGDLEHMTGRAIAAIGADGRLAYHRVCFTEDTAYFPHDVGGGD